MENKYIRKHNIQNYSYLCFFSPSCLSRRRAVQYKELHTIWKVSNVCSGMPSNLSDFERGRQRERKMRVLFNDSLNCPWMNIGLKHWWSNYTIIGENRSTYWDIHLFLCYFVHHVLWIILSSILMVWKSSVIKQFTKCQVITISLFARAITRWMQDVS